jgi:hypothetical protein
MYAQYLFELIADTRVGWGTRVTFMLLEAIIGMTLALLIGFVFTTQWLILQQFLWAGGIVGATRGFLASQRLSWRDWLNRLALGLPMQKPDGRRGLVLFFILLVSVIFGPILWLLIIGLFWGMSGVIKWMSKSLGGGIAYDHNAWYFWWRGRPPVSEVEAALEWAADIGLPHPQPTSIKDAVKLWEQPASPPLEIAFLKLKDYARNREVPPPE